MTSIKTEISRGDGDIMITSKQVNFITYLVERSENVFLKNFWQAMPKNNAKYPDKRADYRRMILADRMRELTAKEAAEIINDLILSPKIKIKFKIFTYFNF